MRDRMLPSGARALVLVLAVLIAGGSLLAAVPAAQAPLSPQSPILADGKYTGTNVYVPGETLSFTLEETGAVDGVYDAAIASGNNPLRWYNNVTVPAGGSTTLTYDIPLDLPDGLYSVDVGGPLFDQTPAYPAGRLEWNVFFVQEYQFVLEVDRAAYIGGDTVTVTWLATRLQDNSLAADGYGQIWVYNWNGDPLAPDFPKTFSKASGSYPFDLPGLGDPDFDGIVMGWFNSSSAPSPPRAQQDFTYFEIGTLDVNVVVAPGRPNIYPPGGIVTADIDTFVEFTGVREPDVDIIIEVWDVTTTAVERPQYGATGLTTDAHGSLSYLFQLDTTVADGAQFEVRVNATTQNEIWTDDDMDTFTISVAAGMTLVLSSNQDEYQADETATITAVVSGAAGATITYTYQVRDCSNFNLLAVQTVTTSATTNSYSYSIPTNYAGAICVYVVVDDGAGNQAQDSLYLPVVFGWLLVNANPQEYSPGDRVTVTWTLESNVITDPTYFYEVEDDNGNLVTSGTAASSYVFAIPAQPSPGYMFRVTAYEDGLSLSGTIEVNRVQGFFLEISFDRASYAPGDTMNIHYEISARGTQPLPSVFSFRYGLWNAPSRYTQTSSASGTLTYTVPQGIDEGDQGFGIYEYNSPAGVDEIVTIRGTNPAWFVALGDIPLIVWIILVWLILMTLMLWRRGALGGGMRAPKAPEAPAAPGKTEPVHAPPTSPMTVTCRSCGSPIEITTSKRPIEVMCPKCGNTELVS